MAVTAAAAAFAIAVATTPIAAWLAPRVGMLDRPGPLKVHQQAVPYLGGLAVFAAIAGPVAVARPRVLVPLALALVLGLADDRFEVTPILRLGCEVVIGVAVVATVPGRLPAALGVPFVIVLVVLVINAVNLIDGLDGLATGLMAIASGTFLLYSIKLDQAGALFTGNIGPLLLVIILGICLGFLPWNFHPARVFMGDSGALLLGVLIASSTIAVGGQSDDSFTGQSWFFFAPLVIPLLILGVPLLDVIFAVLRRATRRRGLASADKDHLHHRLLRLGHGYRQTVVVLWLWTGLLSAFALYPAWSGKGTAMIPIGVAAAVLLLFTVLAPWVVRRNGETPVVDAPDEVVDVTAGHVGDQDVRT